MIPPCGNVCFSLASLSRVVAQNGRKNRTTRNYTYGTVLFPAQKRVVGTLCLCEKLALKIDSKQMTGSTLLGVGVGWLVYR